MDAYNCMLHAPQWLNHWAVEDKAQVVSPRGGPLQKFKSPSYIDDSPFTVDVVLKEKKKCWTCGKEIKAGEARIYHRSLEKKTYHHMGCQRNVGR